MSNVESYIKACWQKYFTSQQELVKAVYFLDYHSSSKVDHLQLLLDNLDFADYITLLPQNHQQMQEKLREVEQKVAETGLHISTTTKVQTERHWPAWWLTTNH